MYQKLPNDVLTGEKPQCIKRLSDNSLIPFDPDNRDYQEYLKWLTKGNEPLPADK